LLDVSPAGPIHLETRLIEAYGRWWGAHPLAVDPPAAPSTCAYPGFSSVDVEVTEPLALNPHGRLGSRPGVLERTGEALDPLYEEVIGAGGATMLRDGEVLPGIDPAAWDYDPIVHAAELHRAGYNCEAVRIPEDLIALDIRCVDAWGHLELIAFNTRGSGPALEFYETGVGAAERSLQEGSEACSRGR
jgi:hypothetical protein